MYGGGVRPGIERDVVELSVVPLERIARWLDMPMANTGPRSQPTQKDFDFRPFPLAPSPSGMVRKEKSHPPHAIKDDPFLCADFAENPDALLRPARFPMQRRRGPTDPLTPGRPFPFSDRRQESSAYQPLAAVF